MTDKLIYESSSPCNAFVQLWEHEDGSRELMGLTSIASYHDGEISVDNDDWSEWLDDDIFIALADGDTNAIENYKSAFEDDEAELEIVPEGWELAHDNTGDVKYWRTVECENCGAEAEELMTESNNVSGCCPECGSEWDYTCNWRGQENVKAEPEVEAVE
jgi:hypothetical protein